MIVFTGSLSLSKTNLTSFLLNEIEPFACLSSLNFLAILLIIYIAPSTSLFISFFLLFKEISGGIVLVLLSVIN